MICFTSSLKRQFYHFATDFNRVLLQLMGTDIENSLFKHRVSYRHPTFMIAAFKLLMKSCGKKLIRYSCIFNVQLSSLEKVNFKVQTAVSEELCHFNKIRRICCVNIAKTPIYAARASIPMRQGGHVPPNIDEGGHP